MVSRCAAVCRRSGRRVPRPAGHQKGDAVRTGNASGGLIAWLHAIEKRLNSVLAGGGLLFSLRRLAVDETTSDARPVRPTAVEGDAARIARRAVIEEQAASTREALPSRSPAPEWRNDMTGEACLSRLITRYPPPGRGRSCWRGWKARTFHRSRVHALSRRV